MKTPIDAAIIKTRPIETTIARTAVGPSGPALFVILPKFALWHVTELIGTSGVVTGGVIHLKGFVVVSNTTNSGIGVVSCIVVDPP
ncbi:16136_t:CDS:2 [Entrophospora sp. SA101]|nr:16136_t:CDS:2 [Entrophospora sp. SA101]